MFPRSNGIARTSAENLTRFFGASAPESVVQLFEMAGMGEQRLGQRRAIAQRQIGALAREGGHEVTEVFTPLKDVEQSLAQPAHLQMAFAGRLDAADIAAAMADVVTFRRDELVEAARVARGQIRSGLYDGPRKRAKPECAASGMPDAAPGVAGFLPPNGITPVAFEHSHGKKLMAGIRLVLHHLVGNPTGDVEALVSSLSEELRNPAWEAAFAPEEQA